MKRSVPEAQRLAEYFADRASQYSQIYDGSATGLVKFWWRNLPEFRVFTRRELGSLPGRKVLEVGCGTGHLMTDLAEHGATVLAIDLSPKMVQLAAARAIKSPARDRITIECTDFESFLTGNNAHFDIALAIAVMEYSNHPDLWLSNLKEICDEVVLTWPIRTTWGRILNCVKMSLYGRFTMRSFARSEVDRLMDAAEWITIKSCTMGSTYWVHAAKDTK